MVLHTGRTQAITSPTTVSSAGITEKMLHDSAYALADKYNDATANFDQTVSVNGAKVSTLSTGMMSCSGFGIHADFSERAAMAQVGAQVS